MVIASERSISSAALTCLGTRNGHGVSREAVILRQAIQRQEIRCNKKLRKRRKSVILAASAAPLDAASLQPQRLARVRRAKAGRRRNHPHFMLATSDEKIFLDFVPAASRLIPGMGQARIETHFHFHFHGVQASYCIQYINYGKTDSVNVIGSLL